MQPLQERRVEMTNNTPQPNANRRHRTCTKMPITTDFSGQLDALITAWSEVDPFRSCADRESLFAHTASFGTRSAQSGFFVLPNDLPKTFRRAQTCCSVVVRIGDARIGVVQKRAAQMGVLAKMRGGGRCRRRAKHVRAHRHADGRKRGHYEIQYSDVEGAQKTCMLPREFFQRPTRVVEQLLKVGASLPHNNKAALDIVKRAVETIGDSTRRITRRGGRYEYESFVYPGETFGKLKGRIIYQKSEELDPALGRKAGSFEAWRDGLREPRFWTRTASRSRACRGGPMSRPALGASQGSDAHSRTSAEKSRWIGRAARRQQCPSHTM
jgi:hypothetical protein